MKLYFEVLNIEPCACVCVEEKPLEVLYYYYQLSRFITPFFGTFGPLRLILLLKNNS